MSEVSEGTSKALRVALAPVVDRSAVALHLDELRAAFAKGGAVEIGCDDVQQIGQAGLQLLASAARTGRERGIAVSFTGCSAIEPVIRLAAMTDLLLVEGAAA